MTYKMEEKEKTLMDPMLMMHRKKFVEIKPVFGISKLHMSIMFNYAIFYCSSKSTVILE
jgi:hypothetical protein